MNPASHAWQWLTHQAVRRLCRDREMEQDRFINAYTARRGLRASAANGAAIEPLERRQLLSISPSLSGTTVTFASTDSDDTLYLRTAAGFLEWRSTGTGAWSRDLDSAAGDQTLSTAAHLTVRSELDGLTTLTGFAGAGLTLEADGDARLSGILTTAGGDLTVEADAIEVLANATLSTRLIASGDHASADSTGNSGDLIFQAAHISVRTGAKLLTFANFPHAGGDVTFTAEDVGQNFIPWVDLNTRNTQILLENATVHAHDVTFTALSDAGTVFDADGAAATLVETTIDFLSSISELAGVAISNADASITLGTGTHITANSFAADATAKSEAIVRAVNTALAIAYGESNPTAKVDVQGNVTLNSDTGVTLRSNAESELNIAAKQSLLGPTKSGQIASFTIAVADSEINSDVNVAGGARITAGGVVDIDAEMTKDHSVSAAAGAYEEGSVGTGVAVSLSTSNVNANVGGTVSGADGVSINATSNTPKNDTNASSAVGASALAKLLIGFKDKAHLASITGSILGPLMPTISFGTAGKTKKLALSAAVAYTDHVNNAVAQIAPGATVTSSGGDAEVAATVTDVPEISAISTIDSDQLDVSGPQGNSRDNSVSAGVIIGNFDNNTDAAIRNGATVNAAGRLDVRAETILPYDIQWAQLASVSDITDKLNPNFGLQNGLFTTWSQSLAIGNKTALGGAVTIFDVDNTAEAVIETGAQINQDTNLRSAGQDVAVIARTDVETVNLAGIAGVLFFGTKAANGVGGAYLESDYTNDASAVIQSGAKVYGHSLLVRGDATNRTINFSESGGKTGTFGFNGSMGLAQITNTVLSQIDDGAIIETGGGQVKLRREHHDPFGDDNLKLLQLEDPNDVEVEIYLLALDSNGDGKLTTDDDAVVSVDDDYYTLDLDLLVAAEDESEIFNFAGAIGISENVGIGVSIAVADIDRTTRALIGNLEGEADSITGSVNSTDAAVLALNRGVIGSGSLAASVAAPSKADDLGDTPDDPYDSQSLPGLFGETPPGQSNAQWGVGISGEASVNTISDVAEAYISDTTITADGNLLINAKNDSEIFAVGISVAISTATKQSVGLAGSFAWNQLDESAARAFTENATITAGDLTVSAETAGSITSLSASGSVAHSQQGFALAGNVSINDIEADTLAYIGTGSAITADRAWIKADNNLDIFAVGGAATYGGKAGIGFGLGFNLIDSDTLAYTTGADVTIVDTDGVTAFNNDLDIRATNSAEIFAVAAAIGASAQGMAAAVSLSANLITGETKAYVNGRKTTAGIDVAHNLFVYATDNAAISSISGGLTYGGQAGVGAGLAYNEVDTIAAAFASATTIDTGEAAWFEADANISIDSISAGAGVSTGFAAGGSVSINYVDADAAAYIDGSFVTSDKSVVLDAAQTSEIAAIAGTVGISTGSVAVGAAIATNNIGTGSDPSSARAYIDNSAVESTEAAVLISATGDSIIKNITAAGTFSGTFAGNGSVSVNNIYTDTAAYIEDSANDAGTKYVKADLRVELTAADKNTISVIAGSISGSGTAAGGAAVATAYIGTDENAGTDNPATVRAFIDNSSVTSTTSDILLSATTNSAIFNIAAGVAGSGTVALMGSAAVNNIHQSLQATATGSTLSAGGDVTMTAEALARTEIELGALQKESSSTPVSSFGGGNGGDERTIGNIMSFAGGIAGGGTGALGAAISKNNITNRYEAGATDSTITAAEDVNVAAGSQAKIETASAAVAGDGVLAAVGSVSLNDINNTTLAHLTGSSVTANNASNTLTGGVAPGITLDAIDNSTIRSLGGALGLSGTVGLGGAAAYNEIANTTRAYVGPGSTIVTKGSLTADAQQTSTIETISIAGGIGGVAGAAGNVSINIIENTTESYIEGTIASPTSVTADDSVYLLADNSSTIKSYGGSIAVGAFFGLAGGVATNLVSNDTRAFVDRATVVAKGTGPSLTVKRWTAAGDETTESARGLFVIADSNEKITTFAVGASGGVAGIAGEVAVTRVADTTEAYIVASDVNSLSNFGGAVKVKAHQDTDIEATIDGVTVGGAAVGGAVGVNLVQNTTRAFIGDEDASGSYPAPRAANVYASSIEVRTHTQEDVESAAIGMAISAGFSVAGVVVTNVLDSSSDAYVLDSNLYTTGALSITADNEVDVTAYAGTLAASVFKGGGGSFAVTTVLNDTRARSVGSRLNATGATTIDADSNEDMTAHVGTAGVGLLSFGVAGAVSVSYIETTTEAYVDHNAAGTVRGGINQDSRWQAGGVYAGGSGQDISITASNVSVLDAMGGSLGAGLTAGVGVSVDVGLVRNRAVAYVGDRTDLYAADDVTVEADGDRTLDSAMVALSGGLLGLSGSISVLVLGGAPLSEGVSEFTDTLKAQVNGEIALGSLDVDSGDATASRANSILNAQSDPTIDNALNTNLSSSGQITAAYIDHGASAATGATITAGGDITIDSGSRYDLDLTAGSASATLVGVGGAFAVASITEVSRAFAGNNATLSAGGNVMLSADSSQKSSGGASRAHALSGQAAGVLTVGGGLAKIDANIDVDANLGTNAKITDASAVSITANGTSNFDAEMEGYSIAGGAAVGATFADVDVTSDVDAALGTGAQIGSTANRVGSVSLSADTDNTANVEVAAVAGALIASGAAASATADVDPDARAQLGTNAKVYAAGPVSLTADSTNDVDASGDARGGAAVAKGDVVARARINSAEARVATAAGSLINAHGTQTVDGDTGNVTLDADTDSHADATTTGSGGGLVADQSMTAEARIGSVDTIASVGGTIDATGTVTLSAEQRSEAISDGEQNGGGAVAINEVDATSRIVDADTEVRVEDTARITARKLDMRADDVDVLAQADAYANSNFQLAGDADAHATGDADSRAFAFVGGGSEIAASEQISIVAYQTSVKTDTWAKTAVNGVQGALTSTADNDLTAAADVLAENGALMQTRDLYVLAYSPVHLQGNYVRDAETDAKTVTEFVKVVVGEACEIVVTIFTFGLVDEEEVCEPVYDWVAVVTQSPTEANYRGTKNVSSEVDFNADVTILGEVDPVLKVNADGVVTEARNVQYTDGTDITVGDVFTGDEIAIDDIINNSEGSVEITAREGTVRGNAVFRYKTAYGKVEIVNNSDKDLRLQDIRTINPDPSDPALRVLAGMNHANFTSTTNGAQSVVEVRSNDTGDILVAGHIQNALNLVDLYAADGDIFAMGDEALIEFRTLELRADNGSLGTASAPLPLLAVVSSSANPTSLQDVYAGENAWLTLTAFTGTGQALEVGLDKLEVSGLLDLTITDGIRHEMTRLLSVVLHAGTAQETTVLGILDSFDDTGFYLLSGGDRVFISNADIVDTDTDITRVEQIFDVPTSASYNFTGTIIAGGDVNITAGNVTQIDLTANIDQADTAGNEIDATATGNISLVETAAGGDMQIGTIASTGGDVTLEARGGSMLDIENDSAADVIGQNLTLLTSAAVGSAANDLDIDSGDAGLVRIIAGTDITLEETAGDLTLDTATAGGKADLTAAGAILDGGDTSLDVVAEQALLLSSSGVGTAVNALDTQVSHLEGDGGTGGFYLTNTGGLTVGGADAEHAGISADGDIVVTALSPLTVNEDVTSHAGDITLTATDAATAGDDLTVNADLSAADAVSLLAGDNFRLATGATITAGGAVTIFVDAGDADAGTGAALDLFGAVHAASLTMTGNGDADTFNIRRLDTDATLNAGADDDTINVGSLAPAIGGTVDGIANLLTIDAGTGSDVLNVDDRGEADANWMILTPSRLTGLDMGGNADDRGIAYGGVETMNIDLGSGDDLVNVQGTGAGVTNLALHAGDESVYVSRTAAVKQAADRPAYLFGHLDDVDGSELNITAGTGRHLLMVSDSTATVSDIATVTRDRITGLAEADINYTTDGSWADGVTIWSGAGSDTIMIESTHRADGVRTITALHTGGGDDRVTVDLHAGEDGFFTVNTQDGNDAVDGSTGSLPLYAFGGAGNDTLTGGSGPDVLLGDRGRVAFHDEAGNLGALIGGGGETFTEPAGVPFDRTDGVVRNATEIFVVDPGIGGDDQINAGAGNDIAIGGNGSDDMSGGAGNDLLFGDHGRVSGDVDPADLPLASLEKSFIFTAVYTAAEFGAGDAMHGGTGADILLGQQGSDLVRGEAGDDDLIGGHNVSGGSDAGDVLDGGFGHDAIAGDNASILRTASNIGRRMRTLSGAALYDSNGQALVTDASQANPTGVEERDIELFEGFGSTATGGADRIAGGADDDVIFGQFGNDLIEGDGDISLDIAGGASVEDFAGAGTDGDDYIEGNAGDDVLLGNLGQDDLIGGSSDLYGFTTAAERGDGDDTIYGGAGTRTSRYDLGDTSESGHSRDADVIVGDNGRILRLVGTHGTPDGQFLHFTYDYYSPEHVTVRAVGTLDNAGGDDLLLGEAGDDSVWGMAGNDVLFGHGQDDDLIGGGGHDRIYGGSGEDGILGDDGFIRTSRNGLTETLWGVTSANLETNYSLPGPFTGTWEYITGRLLKVAELLAHAQGGNDVIYGGTGDDFLHAGAGDDAVSGAEATAAFYTTSPVSDFNPLRYDPATRKLAAYDADNPRQKIDGFLLNFDTVDENGNKIDDGKDRIFGDHGHDWLVGGTMNDRLFGGRGDDVINADDNHDTSGGLNDQPDDPDFADADFVYGGAGLDVMIANTGGDRMYDWLGEFNSFIVPFSPFGAPTVNRSPSPHIMQFIADLGRASGADQSLAEPDGELGLFDQQDGDWRTDKGKPRDPQPGNGRARRDTQGGPEDDRHTALQFPGTTSGSLFDGGDDQDGDDNNDILDSGGNQEDKPGKGNGKGKGRKK